MVDGAAGSKGDALNGGPGTGLDGDAGEGAKLVHAPAGHEGEKGEDFVDGRGVEGGGLGVEAASEDVSSAARK